MTDPGSDLLKKVRLLHAAFNNHDVGGVVAMMHPEVELILADERGNPFDDVARSGHEAVRAYCDEMRVALGRPAIQGARLTELDGAVTADVVIRGVDRRNNVEVEFRATQFFGFEDGLVRTFRTQRSALPDGAPAAAVAKP